jgi:hypothetical protein
MIVGIRGLASAALPKELGPKAARMANGFVLAAHAGEH